MEELKTISQAQLIKKLKRDKNIGYLAFVTSSWHYISALAAIKWLNEKYNVKKGVILVCEHLTDGYIINNELMDIECVGEREVYDFKFGALATETELRKYLLNHKQVGNPFFILKPVIPKIEFSVVLYNSNVRKNIVHITIEEGLATYMRDWKSWAFEEGKFSDFADLWKQLKLRTWGKYINETALRRRGEFIDNSIFNKRGNRLVKNNRVIHYYKKIFKVLSREFDLSCYGAYENSVIICTQPYGEQNHICNGKDVEVIRRLCHELAEKGEHVIIKPHPREKKLYKYDKCEAVLDLLNDVPLEIVLAGLNIKPKCIIGITTTTLVTAKLFWNIPTISIARIIDRSAYTSKFVGDIDNFCNVFADIVQLPEGIRDI